MKEQQVNQRWMIASIAYMLILAYVSTKPPGASQAQQTSTQIVLHNMAHVPAYSILAYFLLRCFSYVNKKSQLWTFIIALAFGGYLEVMQSFVPGRYMSLSDMLLNALGAGIVVWIMGRTRRVG